MFSHLSRWIGMTLLSLSFVSTGHALPHPLEGQFTARLNQVEVLQAQEIEAVWTISQEGRERLEQLKMAGAECAHKGRGLYRCRRFLELATLPQRLIERLDQQWTSARLTLGQAERSELLFKGEGIEEHLVFQPGTLTTAQGEQHWSEWRYFYGLNQLEKIQPGQDAPSPYSFVRQGRTLELIKSMAVTLDRFRFQQWLVALPFDED